MKTKFWAAAVAVLGLALASACGGGGGGEETFPSPGGPPVSGGGSVAPNVFMTFEGQRYRAVNVGSDLVERDDVAVAGTTDDIDIDHSGAVEVYRPTDGAPDVLYTLQPGQPAPEEEGGPMPDVWLEWAPEDGVVTPPGSGQVVPPDQPVSSTPVPDARVEVDPSVPVAAARAALAGRLGLSPEEVEVVSVESVEWPDSCLGAGGPAEACLLVITPGYRVGLAAGGVEYVYHTDASTNVRPAP